MTEAYEPSFQVDEFDEEWGAIPNPDAVLPDGTYQAKVTGSRTVQANDKRWWVLDLQDLGGGGAVTKWSDFDHEVGRKIIKEDAVRMGFRGESFSDLVEAIETGLFEGTTVEIVVKTTAGDTRDFTNVYINKGYDGPLLGGEAPADTAATDDDIPF